MFDFGIIGGGVSGMYASILLAAKGYSVAVFEANDRVGKKLLATGNGKCNLSNVNLTLDCYNTPIIADIVKAFDMQSKMRELGLITKVKSGRIYPFSEQAAGVLNVLLCKMARSGVQVITSCEVTDIQLNGSVRVVTSKGIYDCKKVCLASGSAATFGKNSLALYEKFGHMCNKCVPSLAPLISTRPNQIKGLSGVRQEAMVSLYDGDKMVAVEFGEVQFRRDGISGIVIMNMSARMCWQGMTKGTCYLDFMPQFSAEEVEAMLQDDITARFGMLNKNIMLAAKTLGVSGVKRFRVDVARCADFDKAQVTSGGLSLTDFDLHSMQSRRNDALFAVGEALDVDGCCGGYNLHWAFASAYNFAKEF